MNKSHYILLCCLTPLLFLFAAPGCSVSETSKETPASIIEVHTEEAFNEILASEKPVVVDFYATWCGPCKILLPFLEELAEDKRFKEKMIFVKVDVDEIHSLSHRFRINSIPDVRVFVDKKEAKQLLGLHPKSNYEKTFLSFVNSEQS